jgi:chondroitin 4-sulfotransferase 11
MISPDRRWIFVHIQKTGGTAVRSALGVEISDVRKHFFARELREVYGQAAWEQSFKFAFVRNPWDRLVSWWSMINGGRARAGAFPLNKFSAYVLRSANTFEEFIANCTEEIRDSDGRKHIFRNQIDYLTDENGRTIVDFIGRFERLQEDFDVITRRLGFERLELPRVNESQHLAYEDYYSPAMAEAVSRIYERDIATFSYRFGE